MNKQWFLIAAAWIVAWGAVRSIPAAERVDIELGPAALKDPLVEFVSPPSGSPDRVRFQSDGILIQQLADQPGKTTGVTGFKLLTSSEGDFEFQLDFDVRKLKPPTEGWGHAITIRIMLDDPAQPHLVAAYQATRSQESAVRAAVVTEPADGNQSKVLPYKYQSGTWTLRRTGGDFTVAVATGDGEPVELARLPCSRASVREVQVWCTRLPEGNAEAEFLLKRARFLGDAFFTYETPRGGWNWTWHIVGLCVVNAIVLALYVRERMKPVDT